MICFMEVINEDTNIVPVDLLINILLIWLISIALFHWMILEKYLLFSLFYVHADLYLPLVDIGQRERYRFTICWELVNNSIMRDLIIRLTFICGEIDFVGVVLMANDWCLVFGVYVAIVFDILF
jgi:hypothetical protein